MTDFIIEVNETYNYKKVTCREGHYITNWDKADVMKYTYAKIMYCPLDTNLEEYYCVTEEEHAALVKEMEQRLVELELERKGNK